MLWSFFPPPPRPNAHQGRASDRAWYVHTAGCCSATQRGDAPARGAPRCLTRTPLSTRDGTPALLPPREERGAGAVCPLGTEGAGTSAMGLQPPEDTARSQQPEQQRQARGPGTTPAPLPWPPLGGTPLDSAPSGPFPPNRRPGRASSIGTGGVTRGAPQAPPGTWPGPPARWGCGRLRF